MIDHEKVNALVMAKASLDANLKLVLESLKDTYVPLDGRWTVYDTLVKRGILTKIDLCGDGFLDDLDTERELTLYDDFYVNRYETVRYVDMMEKMSGDYGRINVTPESLSKWKEKVLRSGTAGFRYDW